MAPLIGRAIRAADDVPDAPCVTVLSYGLWQRRFGGKPGALGTKLKLSSGPGCEVIGVMPAGFAASHQSARGSLHAHADRPFPSAAGRQELFRGGAAAQRRLVGSGRCRYARHRGANSGRAAGYECQVERHCGPAYGANGGGYARHAAGLAGRRAVPAAHRMRQRFKFAADAGIEAPP